MRFSVLLPTRNGGPLIAGAVHSVLDQEYDDAELIVSNNASQDGTAEILAEFDDPRLRVLTLDSPVGVTENWNHCLAHATGDYVMLLGDDDVLLPGYFQRAEMLLGAAGSPDVLLYNGFAYAFPGFAGSPHSHYADPFYSPAARLPLDGPVPLDQRRRTVGGMFAFRFDVHLNMQTALVARTAIEQLRAGCFRPPFPDFYALNALMLTVGRWVMSSERLVVVGVSPKSFGRTIHSSDQARGLAYLGIEPAFAGQLPGSEIVNGTYETLLALKADYGPELAGIEIDRAEYVVQQLYAWFVQARLGSLSLSDVGRRARLLGGRDWALAAGLLARRARPAALRRRLDLDRDDPAAQLWPGMRPVPGVNDIGEFAHWIARREAPARE